MLDNHVVDQTYLKVFPTETLDLCLLCFKKIENQDQVSGMYIY